MTTTLRLGPHLALPIDAITQKLAFIARSGAGKTYAAGKLAEEMLDAGAQVVVLDPVGVWYGLRLAADGKKPGISIAVFGGEHGDVPLEPAAGAMVADVVVDHSLSVVLDVSGFTQGEMKRFLTAFAERLFHRKKAARSPVHFFLEEAQTFVPQRALGEDARMLGAFERLCKLGRNYGIGVTLISQRPQAVHKDVLNQTEALFVGQVNGTQERKALEAWVAEQASEHRGLVATLPSLPVGTMYLWSPQWLRTFSKVTIGQKRTYNASATPIFGDPQAPTTRLAPVDLEAIRAAMKDAVERASADDPKVLRAKIAQLQREIDQGATKTKEVMVPVLSEQHMQRLECAVSTAQQVHRLTAEVLAKTESTTALLMDALQQIRSTEQQEVAPLAVRAVTAVPRPPAKERSQASASPAGELNVSQRTMLTAILQAGDEGVSRDTLGVLTGYARSTRDRILQELRAPRYIEHRGRDVVATEAGRKALPEYQPLPKGDALRSYWMGKLPEGNARVLANLVEAYPLWVEREALDDRLNYATSTRNRLLQELAARRLIERQDSKVRASRTLFGAS